ncbi:MAG TPA: archease [Candidatus Nanoarchaeia archaeon]|nr:archease [Candidatus Nanoarchaeia archaeon]
MTYTFLDHTADVLFQAEGRTLEELFAQCALAVEDTQVNIQKIKPKKTVKIALENKTLEKLLFDFLDELLFYKDAEQLLFSAFAIKIQGNEGKYLLSCTASGEKLDVKKHESKVDIKAITMHLFEIKKTKKGWWAQVLVDV